MRDCRLVALGQQVGVAGLLGHLVADLRVLEVLDHALERLDLRAQDLQFGDDLLGVLRIVPEVGGAHALDQRVTFGDLARPVKESRGWR
jgi:hypothetical protein